MTLIVGVIEGSSVTVTGDTKITYDEDAIKTASLFEEALPKIVLLRDDLAVGVAGEGPCRIIEDLMKVRDAGLADVLDYLRAERNGDFVVGALNPSRLYRVHRAGITEFPEFRHAWVGDGNAYDIFENLASSWVPDDSEFIRVKTSMDSLVARGSNRTVGGFALTAHAPDGRFRFVPTTFTIYGDTTENFLDSYAGQLLPGDGLTPGALGIYVSSAGSGRLFTHERPFEGIKILAPDRATFASRAFSEHGQMLLTW